MQFRKYIFSRGVTKTGQIAVAVGGDDATYQAGWWLKRSVANNRDRFVVKGEEDNILVFDRATGLMWAGDGDGDGCNGGDAIAWSDAIIYAEALVFEGFNDWRIPNIKEVQSILNYSKFSPPVDEPPFAHTGSVDYWSSTTVKADLLNAWYVSGATGGLYHEAKTKINYVRCVRLGI